MITSLLFAATLAAPVTIYVAPNGDDRWSGKLATANHARTDGPLATLQAAQLKARAIPKDRSLTVSIGSGAYRLTQPLFFGPEDSGTEGHLRRWQGPSAISSGAMPALISGMKPITGWRKLPNGWFRTNLPEVKAGKWDFIQLFVNGERRYRPRLPKRGYYNIAEHVDPTPESKGKGNDRFQFRAGDIRSDWANRDDVDVLNFHEWIMSRNRIKSVSPLPVRDSGKDLARLGEIGERSEPGEGEPPRPLRERSVNEANRVRGEDVGGIVTFKAPTGTDAWWRDFNKGYRFLVENVKEALSEPGEWYLDKPTGDLTYIPKPGETLANVKVEAPVATSLVEFKGDLAAKRWVQYVVFAGLHLEGTNWTAPPEGRNFPQAEADLRGAVNFSGARDCEFTGCSIAHTGTYGVDIGPACKRITIAKNEMADLGAGGIKIGEMAWQKDPELLTERCTAQVNSIHGGGRIHPAAVGVWIGQNPYNHVGGNFIWDLYYTGISVGWSWGYQDNGAHHNTILGNRIGHIGQGVLSDMGGIYTLGPQAGTVIQRNQIHDIQSFSYGGWGIYPDEGSTGIRVENNVVFRTKSAGFHQHYGKENVITNNVFAFGKEAQIMRTRAEEHLSFTMDHNLVLFGDAPLLGSNWSGNNYKLDFNLYWRVPPPPSRGRSVRTQSEPGEGALTPPLVLRSETEGGAGGGRQSTPAREVGKRSASSEGANHLARMGEVGEQSEPGEGSLRIFASLRLGEKLPSALNAVPNPKSEFPNPQSFDFAGMTFAQWQAKGQDVHSLIADPLFMDPAKGDFRLKPNSPALTLGFKPFSQLDCRGLAERKLLPPAFPLPAK